MMSAAIFCSLEYARATKMLSTPGREQPQNEISMYTKIVTQNLKMKHQRTKPT